MSNITGPQQPRDATSPVRGAEKPTSVSKDPDGTPAQQRETPDKQNSTPQGSYSGRNPAVSIAGQTASLHEGQQINGAVTKFDGEGRPIVDTPTVTLALRPDAGLKTSDTVSLKITQAGQELNGQIVERNGTPENNPALLHLTVINTKGSISSNVNDGSAEKLVPRAYGPHQRAQEKLIRPNEHDASQLLTNQSGRPTLANSPSRQDEGIGPDGNKPQNTNTAFVATHIAETNATTNVQNEIGTNVDNSTGLGKPIPATTKDGSIIQLQEIDVAISRVPPQEIAVIERIVPLAAAEAKTLTLPAALLSQTDDGVSTNQTNTALVKLETSRGSIIASAVLTEHLSGQSVRVSASTESVAPQQPAAQNSTEKHKALWIDDKTGSVPRKINVQLLAANSPQTAESQNGDPKAPTATISAIQTLAAFIGAEGPRADLRLQTTLGDVSLTLPSAQRPKVGDTVVLLPAVSNVQTSETLTAPPTAPTSSPEVGGILSNWPVFEEAITALSAAKPEDASALAERSAQGGGKLANSLLFFLKAAGRLDPAEAWIGDKTTRSLEDVSGNILRQLKSDFRQMAAIASEPIGEWRSIILPFETRLGDFPLVALLVQNLGDEHQKGSNEQDSDEEDAEKQRFIVQVEFSVLGDIQLDGTIKDTKFDLTVRSKRAFSASLIEDTRSLFERSLAANGFSGALDFEHADAFAVDAADITSKQLMHAHASAQ